MSARNPDDYDKYEDEGDENHLLDINIYFEPIPSKDFDDLEDKMDADNYKIMDAWIGDAETIIEKNYPDYEGLTYYVQDLDRDEDTCTIQITTRVDWMDRMNDEDADYTKKLKEFVDCTHRFNVCSLLSKIT